MTTVQYHLNSNGCQNPELESEYSIHFEGKLTRDEFHHIMHEYQDIISRFNVNKFIWIWIGFFVLASGLWVLPVFVLENSPVIWCAVGGFQFAFIILWVILRRRTLLRRNHHIEHYTHDVNARLAGRGVHFRTHCASLYGYGYGRAYRNLTIYVELAAQHHQPQFATVVTPQVVYAQPQPQYYTQPPVYVANENQPLLHP
eukprot:TRINITY_DN111_c0_g1_i2.p1 TRINITY_DN111_c0_g1~~TRINITY_DN111_c0_g1_i2.p1  ORF type:complete len:200 (-),score=36.00 TRINITY_DN111_c0_g1_i2:39-638(-)